MKNSSYKNKIIPYESDFETLAKWRTADSVLLVIIGVLSVVIPLISDSISNYSKLVEILVLLSYLLLISYYIINTVIEIFLYPSTANKRRVNFIDNSLGTKLLGADSKYYFDNDELPHGSYKMLVNCFENCFFTYRIAKTMQPSMIVKNAIFITIFVLAAYFGIVNGTIGLPIIQIFISSLFLTSLIHNIKFVLKLKSLLNSFKEMFNVLRDKNFNNKDFAKTIKLFLDYETTLAYNKSGLSDRVYHNLKEDLTDEWGKLKEYYNIS